MSRTTDFGAYVEGLCLNLEELQAQPGSAVTLTCNSERIILDLDVVTAMGIVVAELVTNSYEHAFPGSKGAITVLVRRTAAVVGMATMTIRDNGIGFETKPTANGMGSVWFGDLSNRFAEPLMLDTDHGTVWTIRFPIAHAVTP